MHFHYVLVDPSGQAIHQGKSPFTLKPGFSLETINIPAAEKEILEQGFSVRIVRITP